MPLASPAGSYKWQQASPQPPMQACPSGHSQQQSPQSWQPQPDQLLSSPPADMAAAPPLAQPQVSLQFPLLQAVLQPGCAAAGQASLPPRLQPAGPSGNSSYTLEPPLLHAAPVVPSVAAAAAAADWLSSEMVLKPGGGGSFDNLLTSEVRCGAVCLGRTGGLRRTGGRGQQRRGCMQYLP